MSGRRMPPAVDRPRSHSRKGRGDDETRFWLIRHAIVEENARAMLYGVMDVPLCETSLLEQAPMYRALAARLPRPAAWKVTPLSRTRRTAEAIFAAGYPRTEPAGRAGPDRAEPGRVAGSAARRTAGAADACRSTPSGRSPATSGRRAARPWPRSSSGSAQPSNGWPTQHPGEDVVIVSHGGAIRAAVAHCLRIGPDNALHLTVQNLSLTRLERSPDGWRVVCVNELPGY